MIARKPKAAMLAHYLAANVGEHNAVVASHKTLAQLLDIHPTTVKRAIADLVAENWVEVRQIGLTGTACAYVLNHRVAWAGKRDNIRYALFSANVIVASDEQPDRGELGEQQPLRKLPRLYPGEQQMPAGEGEPPPSEPSLPGLEPDLPAMHEPADRQPMDEAQSLGSLTGNLLDRLR
jgi:DNA-binding transcriptional MocR family regulator